MIDIIILFLLLMGTLVGLKRGFILQFIKLISFVVSILVASMFYQSLACTAYVDSGLIILAAVNRSSLSLVGI